MKLEFGGVTYVVRHEIKVTGNFLSLLMSVTHSHCTGLVFHLAIFRHSGCCALSSVWFG